MSRGYFNGLDSLIREGLLEDGDVLRYRGPDGKLHAVGRARPEGIEVPGVSKPLGITAFEAHAGARVPQTKTSSCFRPPPHAAAPVPALDPFVAYPNTIPTGTTYRRSAQYTVSTSGKSLRCLQKDLMTLSMQRAVAEANTASVAAMPLLDDENDEFCYVCCLGVRFV